MKTDSQLQSDVMAGLQWEPKVDAAHIGVAARHNVITLTGRVAHYIEKSVAENTAKGVCGVKAVVNEIIVRLHGPSGFSDEDIAEAAVRAFKWDYEVPSDQIKITVTRGTVKLEGVVNWRYQKDAAHRCVQYILGVTAINNLITIQPKVEMANVKKGIEDALRRSAELDARRIGVMTDDGTVTLSGSVSSWVEHDQALAAAWAAPGVNSVKDELAVTV